MFLSFQAVRRSNTQEIGWRGQVCAAMSKRKRVRSFLCAGYSHLVLFEALSVYVCSYTYLCYSAVCYSCYELMVSTHGVHTHTKMETLRVTCGIHRSKFITVTSQQKTTPHDQHSYEHPRSLIPHQKRDDTRTSGLYLSVCSPPPPPSPAPPLPHPRARLKQERLHHPLHSGLPVLLLARCTSRGTTVIRHPPLSRTV